MGPEHWEALRQVARDLGAAQRGCADHDMQRTLEAFRQRQSEQERLRHRAERLEVVLDEGNAASGTYKAADGRVQR